MSNVAEYDFRQDPKLSEKWKRRFAFYEEYGLPGIWSVSPEYRAGFRALSFWKRIPIAVNCLAAFFTFIYLFILGLWKKALLVIALYILFSIIAMIIPVIGRALFGGINVWIMLRTNGYYYKFKVKGIDDWSL